MPVGLRSRVPAKITSSMREPRRVLADCSPSTHEMASAIFDFPQPLGPMMAATPSPWNLSSVRSQNDLNPRICSFFSLSNLYSLGTPLTRWTRDFERSRLQALQLCPAIFPMRLTADRVPRRHAMQLQTLENSLCR